jgi:hypothetical protein
MSICVYLLLVVDKLPPYISLPLLINKNTKNSISNAFGAKEKYLKN